MAELSITGAIVEDVGTQGRAAAADRGLFEE